MSKPIISSACESAEQHAQSFITGAYFSAGFISSRGGKVENQDTCAMVQAKDGTWVFMVADGLGGHEGGRKASQAAVKAVCAYSQRPEFKFEQRETMLNAFHLANSSIVSQQKSDDRLADMRTTLVILFIKDDLAFWGHVGDVRLYHLRDQAVLFQTKDHSVPQMLVDTGDILASEIRSHPDRSRLLNALGSAERKLKVSIPQHYHQLAAGDFFHLSTDGFWEWLVEDKMIDILEKSPSLEEATQLMEKEVVTNALKKEQDHDNLTGLSIKITQAKRNNAHWLKSRYIAS